MSPSPPSNWPHRKLHALRRPQTNQPLAAKMTETGSGGKMPLRVYKYNANFITSSLGSILLFLVVVFVTVMVGSSRADQRQQLATQTAATNAYGEPIKWSFGGWAPLDGQQPGGKAKRQHSNQTTTTPLPPMVDHPHRTAAKSGQFSNKTLPNGRRSGDDSMRESASSTHGKVQFVAPQPEESSYSSGQARHQQQQQQHQIYSGPAYALQMQRPTHFSPPAPLPIVREHLLPSAANYHPKQARGSLGPHNQHQHHNRMQQQQQQQQHQHHQAMMMAAAQQYPRPPVSMHEHQRRLEHQHRQQMMRHQQQMMMHQQQQQRGQHPNPAQMMQIPYQQAKASGHQARFPPMIEGYRVVEGEHPIIFTPPAGMMEAVQNYSQQHPASSATSRAPYASTMAAASEKDAAANLGGGYQSALRQVNSAGAYAEQQQQQQSNNIQDIKQKQQQYEQQQRAQSDKQQADKPGSYLTIPVAVETEGDKVLTADDINEIQKHVIQVLPNLKTADKVVKLADTKLTLASANNFKDAIQQQQQAGPALHQLNYDEHRSTMKQLEQDLSGSSKGYELSSTALPSSPSSLSSSSSSSPSSSSTTAAAAAYSSSSPNLNQATTNAHVQHQQPKSIDDDGQPGPAQQLAEHQYFLATGPMQEVGTVDPDQLAEYNLIKNDLLQNFRYEPTRATSNQHGQQQQQTASTPPMPYTASQPPQPQQQQHQQQQQQLQLQHKPASVTRYFQQGDRMYQQHSLDPSAGRTSSAPQRNNNNNNQLFGRIPGRGYNGGGGQQQMSSTTKTILGGRKVSDVMRNLIHTTPVPMTSPMHVPSIEPEKVDAIQLIASHGNDNKPMVVEPHQLVQHTPEGGFDYNSGGMGNPNPNNNNHTGGQQQQQQQYEQPQQNNQYGQSPAEQGAENGGQQPGGAIIEYVAVGEQALNNALGAAQAQQADGTYEIANQPIYTHNADEQQQQQPQSQENPSSRAPFVYDYTMTADQQHTNSPASTEQSGPTSYATSPSMQQQQQQQGDEPHMFTWSPSIANEHQQQQAELSEHAAPGGHQMDMPATAGYNFFGQSGDQQQPSKESAQEYEQQQQQQQPQPQYRNDKWRSKAGGRQPNPDAQYDGQIVKSANDHESSEHDEAQNSQQAVAADEQHYGQSGYRGHESGHEQVMGASQQQPENQGEGADGYQQQQQSLTTPANQQAANGDGYLATNSYAAGAQFNHKTPSHENFAGQQQEYDQSRQQPARYNYVKLDHDRQQSHLAQQQAQRQAEQQQLYQTTTPMSLTTLASADAQLQQQQRQTDASQIQQQQGSNDYTGQDQSLPSVQSSPESMLINESPMGMPILDQQSLISDPNQDSNQELSSDDGAKQSQPAAVYQVYQAYYAPKDHKPLPGYVRLSLEEFNELFRDAEIQYVDKNNLNGMAAEANRQHHHHQQGNQNGAGGPEMQHAYELQSGGQNDQMKASASENQQSIVVDRRSITSERRSSNGTELENSEKRPAAERKLKFGGAVKKIISIRNSRQAARQQLLKSTILKHKVQQPKKSNIATAGDTLTTISSPVSASASAASNNHPTTKQQQQQPNVVSTASSIAQNQQKSINNKQQSTNKRKSDGFNAATPAKKSLVPSQSQPMNKPVTQGTSKDNKMDKSKISSVVVDGAKKRTSTTTDSKKSGSEPTHH